jgi:ribosomal protein L31
MKQFSQFGIKPKQQGFIGDKIKLTKILNREIIVHQFKIEQSKYKDGKCLHLQIEVNENKHVLFTGSKTLIDMILEVPKENFPFKTTIVTENEIPLFT